MSKKTNTPAKAATPDQPAAPVASIKDACWAIFGEFPEDVIAPLEFAAESLTWLEEIFQTIATAAKESRREGSSGIDSFRIERLAEIGKYVASDVANFADCQHESMRDALRAAQGGQS